MTVEELYGQMVDTFQRETGLALAGDGDMAVRLYAVAASSTPCMCRLTGWDGSASPRRPRGTTWTSMLNCGGWSAAAHSGGRGASPLETDPSAGGRI